IVLLGFLKYFKGGYEIGRINPATDALPLLLLRTAVRRASPQGPHCQSAARQKGRLRMTPQLLRSARRVGFADWARLDTPNKETEAERPVPSAALLCGKMGSPQRGHHKGVTANSSHAIPGFRIRDRRSKAARWRGEGFPQIFS